MDDRSNYICWRTSLVVKFDKPMIFWGRKLGLQVLRQAVASWQMKPLLKQFLEFVNT